jgi:3-deoxy-manno-octulosonate cytidylyltransferase (CMP-KDO synthetase)
MKGRTSPLAVIPARANSSRFPNKVIAKINAKPMVQYVWESAGRAKSLNKIIIATDDETIAHVVRQFGGEAVMTPSNLATGTDRVAFVARQHDDAEIIVNLQGDEPLLPPSAIDALVELLSSQPEFDMATLAVRQTSSADLQNPNIVKVVTAYNGAALYFSRSPLAISTEGGFLKHIGIYAFRRSALMRFCALPVSPLEQVERLEQLRALENGFKIAVHEITTDTIAVDIPSDISKVESFLSKPESKWLE